MTGFSKKKSRILSLDFLRGTAFLGILLLNIESFAFPTLSAPLWQLTNFEGINYQYWWTVAVFFDGTMRGLFSMLFGASCLIILSSNTIASVEIYYRRLLWLFGFGLLNAYIFLWYGDILYGYAIAGMFLFPFKNLNAKSLIVIGFAFTLVTFATTTYKFQFDRKPTFYAYKSAMTASTVVGKTLSKQQKEDIKKFEAKIAALELDSAAVEKEKKETLGNYVTIFNKRWKDAEFFQKWTLYDPYLFWDVLLMMFIGMGLFKSGALSNEWTIKQYLILTLICYAVGLALRIRFVNSYFFNVEDFKKFIAYYEIPTGAYSSFQRVIMTIGHIGFLMLIFNLKSLKTLIRLLANVGRMALTNYLLQSILCGLYFYGFGFGMFGKLELYQAYLFCIPVWIISLVFSNVWLHYFRYGPFEWAWRSLTYRKRQPLIIKSKI